MWKVVGYSVKGGRSEQNEDAYLIVANDGFYAVADGVGGGPKGQEASKAVVKELLQSLKANIRKETILQAIQSANTSVRQLAAAHGVKGMASTLVALWFDEDSVLVFHVGDSRVYRVTGAGLIEQLTHDHTRVLDNEQKSRHVITKAIGAREHVDVDVGIYNYHPGDRFILVSDGISDVITDERMADIVCAESLSLFEKCLALTGEAESRGGRDDKTIILVATDA